VDYLNQRITVRQLVRQPVLAVAPHQSIESAARLMVKHGAHALVVVDAGDNLVGIVTTTDIITAALEAYGSNSSPATTAAPGAGVQHSRLNDEQLKQALTVAAARAGTDADPDFVHRALVNLHARVAPLEQVRHVASRFVQAGQDQQLHSALLRALHAVSRAEEQGFL
jgi:hypothetical protein